MEYYNVIAHKFMRTGLAIVNTVLHKKVLIPPMPSFDPRHYLDLSIDTDVRLYLLDALFEM